MPDGEGKKDEQVVGGPYRATIENRAGKIRKVTVGPKDLLIDEKDNVVGARTATDPGDTLIDVQADLLEPKVKRQF